MFVQNYDSCQFETLSLTLVKYRHGFINFGRVYMHRVQLLQAHCTSEWVDVDGRGQLP